MAISIVLIGSMELNLCSSFEFKRYGQQIKEYRDCPYNFEYLEANDSLTWLFEVDYRLPEIIGYLKEHPRPAHREVYPRVEVYDDDTYWGEQGNKTKPLKVLKNVNLLELLEALKEFAPDYAR